MLGSPHSLIVSIEPTAANSKILDSLRKESLHMPVNDQKQFFLKPGVSQISLIEDFSNILHLKQNKTTAIR